MTETDNKNIVKKFAPSWKNRLKRRLRRNAIKRMFGITAMQKVMKELCRRNVILQNLSALEVFGGTGELQTLDYAHFVGNLEIWEYNEMLRDDLLYNFPNAVIKITDSYDEIKNSSGKYDLIVVDAAKGDVKHGHFENYDLFPYLFKLCKSPAILIFTLLNQIDQRDIKCNITWFDEPHCAARQAFFKAENPKSIPVEKIVKVYQDLAARSGFNIEWYFLQRRMPACYYLVLLIRQTN